MTFLRPGGQKITFGVVFDHFFDHFLIIISNQKVTQKEDNQITNTNY